ncbi:putative holin-like toxin [Listeria rocourtiae]|uniref:putative holin-like toxin n=1 Tax=Listeria rocourtiae TaxID=647910 RepID=UPI003D2F774E
MQTSLWWLAAFFYESRCCHVINGFSWKGLSMTVFESLTIMIAFAALIVAIMNSKNDKK